jgi:glucose/arabinose dehydrogenase
MRIRFVAIISAIAGCAVAALDLRGDDKVSDQPGETFIYVKKATRAETQAASMSAMEVAMKGAGAWYLIGPFDNKGLTTPYPPEQKIDLDARYPGKGEEAFWRKADFPDGKVNDLDHFKQSDHCICYLYRRIDMPAARNVDVSLGSDDGLMVFLNGKLLLTDDAARAAEPDQDHVVLPLKAGQNDLLLKVSNVSGPWAYYFSASIPEKFVAKLNRQLNRDFPLGGKADSYTIDTLPTPTSEAIEVGGLAFRPDGKMYVATRRGDVWLVSNPTDDDPDKITWKPYVRGLHEVLGLNVVGKNDLYLVQRPELTLVRSTKENDVADDFTTICDKFGLSGDYHEFIYGPARDKDGNLFITLNVGFGFGHQSKVPYRGFCMKITPKGEMIPWAYGLRSPNGVNFAPDGRLYFTDNQGEWVPACKLVEVRQGEFYGHAASIRWWPGMKDNDKPEVTEPAIWFPYFTMSRSSTEPVWDTTGGKFGPFAGQCFIGELTESLVMRANLEEVKGRMQGCVFLFRTGFQCGPNRLVFAPDGSLIVGETNRGWGSVGGRPFGVERIAYTGKVPFEMHSMNITPTGWDVHFTQPIDRAKAEAAATYFLESYTYHYWSTYGSDEIDRKQNPIGKISVSADGKTVSLTVPERVKKHVFHLQLKGLTSADGAPLLHADAYYTMNDTP